MSTKIIYLKKASDEAISFCTCGDGRISYPAQMDCPWCGCGWLFTCVSCRKAFTFAEGVEIESSWENLAKADLAAMGKEDPTTEEIADWLEAMQTVLVDVEVGKKYVILDGKLIPANKENIEFEGWYAKHNLTQLPQVLAVENMEIVHEKLANQKYWQENAMPKKERYRAGV